LDFNYLTWIIFLPVAGSILIMLIPGLSERAIKYTAAIFTFVSFALSLVLFINFDRSLADGVIQFTEKVSWIPALNAFYHLGVDGLSLPLVVLTAFLGFLCVLISWTVHLRAREYFAWLLLLEPSILGVFCSLDLLLFFIFWEIEIIPMYFLITIWGSGRKEYSATKYVLYTLFGSAFMLAGILSVYFTTGSLSMVDIANGGMESARVVGSVMLAGALIKMGGYGMIRLCVSMFPEVAKDYAPMLLTLAVISVLYGAALTLRQNDLKRMIAYSSVSHMGFVLLGIFALSKLSITGAALQMVSHGLLTGLMFAVAGLVIHNVGERDLRKLGGLVRQMPIGSFSSTMVSGAQLFTILAAIGVVLAAGYILWMIQRAFYGPPLEQYNGVADASIVDRVYMFALVAMIMLIGIYPAILTDVIKLGVQPIVSLLGG